MKKFALVLGLALAWGAPALAQPVTPAAPAATPPGITPTTWSVQLYGEQGEAGEATQVRLEEVDPDTWRVWITYQGQTWSAPASPLHGGRSVFAASHLVPQAASETPVRRGAAQRLTQQDPAPPAPSAGEGYQPGVPAMVLIRLEGGGSQALVTLRDARERIIGRGAGVVDWRGEADHLAERLEQARSELERTAPLDRTLRQEQRVEALARQHRSAHQAASAAELTSGDLDRVEAASERSLERLADLRERYAELADPQGAEARTLSEEMREEEALLQHARQTRARLEAAEVESGELARIAPAAD
ncbi:MAG TPA: hypothetical protein DEA08_11130, partial [Planctomycetes bacterium]|nr:hypothetical protein [Planctomycetota bacterium]